MRFCAPREILLVGMSVAAIALARPAVALGDSPTNERVQRIEEEIRRLQEEVRQLKTQERKVEVKAEENEAKWQKSPQQVELGTQGLKVVSADQNFILYTRALIQADGSYFMDDDRRVYSNPNGDNLNDSFYLRRVRPILEGTVWKYIDYRIMPDFAGTPRLFDAIVDLRYFRFASLTAGKFKSPISLERLQSASALTFIERAFPTQVAPNREVGFLLHGEFDQPGHPSEFSMLGRNMTVSGNFPMFMYPDFFSYQLAVVDGTSNNGSIDSDNNDSKDFQGRIFSHPFLNSGRAWIEGLGIGLAGSWGNPNDVALSNYQSPGLQNVFVYGKETRGDGVQTRLYPQGYWIWGPFQLLGEYAVSRQRLGNQVLDAGFTTNDVTYDQTVSAWNVTASWVLTGERNVFLNQGIKPFHVFDPFHGGWGAWQLCARVDGIDFGSGVFRNVGTDEKPVYPFADPRISVQSALTWAVGVNWWLNPNVKLMANYSQTSFDGGDGYYGEDGKLVSASVRDRETEKVWQTRVQLGF